MNARNQQVAMLFQGTPENDPEAAIRSQARSLIREFAGAFGMQHPPVDLEALASFRGIRMSTDPPVHSRDAELVPEADGICIRVNRERPRTRQRFSIGHEIAHTFFPDYEMRVQCRKPINCDWADQDDLLEWLCDVAASELLLPQMWFEEALEQTEWSGQSLTSLASRYEASLDATLRRAVEFSREPRAVVFLGWNLKPTQERALSRDQNQMQMFGIDRVAEAATARRLRVMYAVMSRGFREQICSHLPTDKSFAQESVAYVVAARQTCIDSEEFLDLGPIHGVFEVNAVPIYTPDEERGPKGECRVAAVIRLIRRG